MVLSCSAAAVRTDSRRLRRIRLVACAAAKAVDIEKPIPVAPAVTRTVFPSAERDGFSGDNAAVGALWIVRVKE